MSSVEEHYDRLLADVYTWMTGGLELKVEENRQQFLELGVSPKGSGQALDLGCGSGFQSLALAGLGYKVVAVDTNPALLNELRVNDQRNMVIPIRGDMCDPAVYHAYGPFELAVCMGDTIVHLQSLDEVAAFVGDVRDFLEPGGRLIVSFRDLAQELKGVDRAIPVRLEDDQLMSTFLEYGPEHVTVNDLLYVRGERGWELRKSAYRKLRLSPSRFIDLLTDLGFDQIQQSTERGFTTISSFVAD